MKLFSIKNIEAEILGVKIKHKKDEKHFFSVIPVLPRLEVHIVNHCNLNCRGCTHFCNIAPEYFLDISIYIKDLKEINKKINFREIKLLGGEPLLHPDIHKFILETKKLCPDKKIILTTNCILLDRATDDFWKAMKESDVKFQLTKYPPIQEKFVHYLDLIDEKGIAIDSIHTANKFWLLRNPNGTSKANEVYSRCADAYCRQYRNSRLYICPDACYMDLYNKYFNKNIPIDIGIDIYSNSSEEIYKYLTTPKETCKYCVSREDYKYVDWSRSKKEVDEWNTVKEDKKG